MLEIIVRQARAQRNDARVRIGGDFDRHDIERIDPRQFERIGANRAHPFARAAERFEHGHARAAHPMRFEAGRDAWRCRFVPGEHQESRAGLQMRHDALEAAPVQGQEGAILQGPSEPRRCQRKRGWRRKRYDFTDRYMRREQRADAVEERIAAGEHDGALAAPREDRRDCLADRGGPYQRLASRRAGELQMPRAADDELGVRNETPGYGRETVETILADADEREPFLCGRAHAVISVAHACAC